MLKKTLSLFGIALAVNGVLIKTAAAHCPLCTIGAGTVAIGAAWLGLSAFSIGIFLGAFGLAMGLWMGKLLKKKVNLFRHQTPAIGIFSFIATILPLKQLFFDNGSIYISLSGDYGSWLNRTYYFDKFIAGGIVGGIILLISPYLSRSLSVARKGKMLPYQGIILNFLLLIIASLSFEILRWTIFSS
ncbi:hypothetical protein HZA42_05285 [Candidatus Peregrinibacteria bacterium]|nr:hypothetical protein [Candidatus Peregrinibacteria bacterium]